VAGDLRVDVVADDAAAGFSQGGVTTTLICGASAGTQLYEWVRCELVHGGSLPV